MLTDILKEKLSSKFFLLLIKKRKTLPFFLGGGNTIIGLLVVLSIEAGPQKIRPDAIF